MGANMKAVLIRGYGDNDVVRIEEVGRPEPKRDEVLLRVGTSIRATDREMV